MKKTILFLKWNSFCNDYFIDSVNKCGYIIDIYDFPKDKALQHDEKLALDLTEVLINYKYGYVFSFNYYPIVAMACKATSTRYVSWVYDCPYVHLYSNTINYSTNRVFVFDRIECEKLLKLGVNTVRYLPMAGAWNYYDSCVPNLEQHNKYDCDVAFIGSTYTEKKHNLYRYLEGLDQYTIGYIRGLIDSQKLVQGYNFIEDSLTPDIMSRVHEIASVYETGNGMETSEWILANYFINRKITSEERMEILSKISKNDDISLKLYTNDKSLKIGNAINMGPVDYYNEAPFAIKCAKINLNITLRSITSGIPLRALDIMSCGGFLLTNYQQELFDYFVPDEDFVYYEDFDDLINKANYYLKNEEVRLKIAQNGYEKIKDKHGYLNRLDILFD